MGELILGIVFLFIFILVLGVGKIFWDINGIENKIIAIVIWVGGFMIAGWITST